MIGWLKRTDDWINRHRPWALLATVASTLAVVALLNWLTGSDLFRQFFFPEPCDPNNLRKCDPLEWKELFQATVLVLGLPVAFMLWHWRDRNVRDQIEEQRNQVDNQRKDVNLKEFQDVQSKAVGVSGEESPSDGQQILQIAALHQMRAFLRGEFGPAFRRPAFETYCALLARLDAAEWEPGDESANLVPHEVFESLRSILFEDWKWFFWEDYEDRIGWPLAGRSFRGIRLPPGADLAGLDLSRMDFTGSDLELVNLIAAYCWDTKFSHCSLRSSHMNAIQCEGGKFDQSDLAGVQAKNADFSGASLKGTKFHASDFTGANFYKADGSDCAFINTQLGGSDFSASSFMGIDFQNSNLSEARFVSARIYRGSIIGADISSCDFSYAFLDRFYPFEASNCTGTKINSKTRLPHPTKKSRDALLSSEVLEVNLLWETHGAILVDLSSESNDPETEAQDKRIIENRALSEAPNAATKL